MPRLIRAVLDKAGVGRPERASSGVDVIGDIAIVRLSDFSTREKKKIGAALLEEMKNVKVVMEQEGGIEGEYRLRKLTHIAGEERTLTLHRENGCAFRVDVARTYFSPRLSTERLKVADGTRKKDRVLNMFAGVGPFSVLIAKRVGAHVTSCEINGYASELHKENDRLNKVADLVEVINADAADLPDQVRSKFDRILLPHPSAADRFLPVALRLAARRATLVYYRHLLGTDEKEAAKALRKELKGTLPAGSKASLRRVREVGPRWVEMAADVRLP